MHARMLATAAASLLAGILPMNAQSESAPVAIAIHGGAGTISPDKMTPEKERAIRAALSQAVQAGHRILAEGGSSLDAVTAAVRLLEDAPEFNAGKGAVFNAEGVNEMDASIMDGATLNAGAIAAVRTVKNPIDLARRVMTDSKHVMLIGAGAEEFAREEGFEEMPPEYFHTEHRWQQLEEIRAREAAQVEAESSDGWYSTVGAVALDQAGNLAAATSTGGLANKRWGRVGDSPIVGAGTYANNASCAVSGTGHGEFFIRYVVAYDICKRVELGTPLAEAADTVVHDVLAPVEGEGGVIAVDRHGNIAMPFNSRGMYRAAIGTDGEQVVEIYGAEAPDAPLSGVEH